MNEKGVHSPLFGILTSCHLLYLYSFVVHGKLYSILLSTTATVRICVNFIYPLGVLAYIYMCVCVCVFQGIN
jgi:hypothetical protein